MFTDKKIAKSPVQLDQISAVVCCLNSITSIEECLKSLKESNVKEIIVVDGGSTDGSLDVAKKYADILLMDEGRGLGNARNIGLRRATGRYVLHSGPDNSYEAKELLKMLNYMDGTVVAVSSKTIIKSAGYLGKLLNIYKKARFFPGEKNSIGTPLLCCTQTMKDNPFDESQRWSDDAELCFRWKKFLGARFFIANAEVGEIGDFGFLELRSRWRMYGSSDFQVYQSQSPYWTWPRKIESIFYPFRNELLAPLLSRRITMIEKMRVLPFLLCVTTIRYFSWLKLSIMGFK